jgi:hypothetical protein
VNDVDINELREQEALHRDLADGYAVESPCPVDEWHPWQHRDAAGRDAILHGCCQYRARLAQECRRELAHRRRVGV